MDIRSFYEILIESLNLYQDLDLLYMVTVVSKVYPKKVKSKLQKLSEANKCTAIVTYGTVGSTLGLGRLTYYWRDSISFPLGITSQFIGHLFGDGSLTITYTSVTPYFVFTQTIKRFEYVWFTYLKLRHFCNSVPLFNKGLRKGVPYPFIQVLTRSYPIFSILHRLFYVKKGDRWVKTISYDLLLHLDPIALAYWAIDDGTKRGSGFKLCTNGFTFRDAYKLVAILHYVFGLYCTVQNADGKPVVYITTKSVPLFRSLITPYFHPIIMYKLQ